MSQQILRPRYLGQPCTQSSAARGASLIGALLSFFCLADHAIAATESVHYGLFGNVHVAMPNGEVLRTIIFVSDQNGWDDRAEALTLALSGDDALVLGVDLRDYLEHLQAVNDKCAYPAGHFEEMSHWMQRHQGLANFTYPLVVGDGAGATLAYALDAQAPAGTFTGLVTVGYDTEFRLTRSLCPGDAGVMNVADSTGHFRIVPVKQLPNPWLPMPFAPEAKVNGLLASAGSMLAGFAWLWSAHANTSHAAGPALAYAVAHWQTQLHTTQNLPDDVADLPLIEVPVQGKFAQRVAVMLTGDGGWAGLDIAIADQLSQHGIAVVGLSTLKFFWHQRTPEEAVDALSRIIVHYGKTYPDADFIVLGYSFGAGLVPLLINRLPDMVRKRIVTQVLISPDPEAVFEIKIGDWFGSAQHEDAVPVEPEIARTAVPVMCVHGIDEGAGSFCEKIAQQPKVSLVELPGGHHYNGDYAKLGAEIAVHLPPRIVAGMRE